MTAGHPFASVDEELHCDRHEDRHDNVECEKWRTAQVERVHLGKAFG
jgi:hypothetical protein